MRYNESQKTDALKLADEIGAKKASEQLAISYPTILDWRKKRAAASESARESASGFSRVAIQRMDNPSLEMRVQLLQLENAQLREQLARQAKALHELSPVGE
jgi:transposase